MKTPVNFNPVRIHTSIRKGQRDYLAQLARNPTLVRTTTISELLSLMLGAFLSKKPFLAPNWKWIRPEGYYIFVGGKRLKNADWVPLNPDIVDINIAGKVISSEMLIKGLQAVAAEHIQKLRSNETGISMATYNFINWGLTELYPPKIYNVAMEPPELEISF